MRFRTREALILTLAAGLATSAAYGQTATDMAVRFVGMTAISGFEQAMADSLVTLLPGAERDRAGNVVAVLGTGSPVRLAVCPMDEWGYVVGNIHEGGYLTLRRVGRGNPPQFDQGHEGHRVTIWGSRGPVPGVVGTPSTHLRRGRAGPQDRMFTVDDAYVDLGAESPEQVRRLGVDIITPVALEKAPHAYGTGLLAGPEAGQRGSCAALARAYLNRPTTVGTVVVAFTVESRIGHRGLTTLSHTRGPFQETLLLDYPPRGNLEALGTMNSRALETRYDGWQVETIDLADVESMAESISQWMAAPETTTGGGQ